MRHVISLAARAVALVAIAGASSVACNSSTDGAAPAHDAGGEEYVDFCGLPASCQAIVLACHEKDDGTPGEVHDCHETAHDQGTDTGCKAVQTSCVAKCNAAPELEGGLHEHFECEGGTMHGDGGH
jgi:hypothetical protein